MQGNKVENLKNMFSYREWNSEMRELFNKYSLVRELNQELMRELPVYAMYTISEHCKRLREDAEAKLIDFREQECQKFKGQRDAYVELVKMLDAKTYDTLKPILQDYMTARSYYLAAIYHDEAEYQAYLDRREEHFGKKGGTK